MLPINQLLLTPNEYSRPGRKITPVGLVIHWTANEGKGANAVANRNYFENRKLGQTGYGSAHYIVDDHQIVICIPENEISYQVGSDTYTQYALNKFGSYPNATTLGIEICVNSDGNFNDALYNAIELAADICKRYGWNPYEAITTHKAIVGWKDCPAFYVTESYSRKYFGTSDYEGQWQIFLDAVHESMYPSPETEEAIKLFNDIINHWAKDDIEALKEMGVVSGKTDTTFEPDAPITRAETATIVRRAIRYITGK